MKLGDIIHDYDRWNSLTEEERAKLLLIGTWDPFNHFAQQLSQSETLMLKTHPEFQSLRIAFTEARASGDRADLVRKTTDLMAEAFHKLRNRLI